MSLQNHMYPDQESGTVAQLDYYQLLTLRRQITGLEEDRLSKPNRPIVSGRLSVAMAQKLYVVVGALSFAWSMYHGVVVCSAVYLIAIYCYNEIGMSRHWFLKSFLGSIGYVCYCWGTTVIFGTHFEFFF
jgi:4-hydroxybenzoate polyprenyltransferase